MSEVIAELILIFVIVGMVIALGIRSLYRSIRDDRKGQRCGCGSYTRTKDSQKASQ